MVKQVKADLRINGLGSSSGGSFNLVQINGKGEINGDLECTDLQINGLGCISGNVEARSVRVAGKSEIGGDLKAGDIIVDGMAEVRGKLTAERIENRGALRISHDLGAELFKSAGSFTIGGLLNSGKVEIDIYGSCAAREIGGEKIEIRRGRAFGLRDFIDSVFPGLMWKRGLSVDTIEGDEIFIEDTTAKMVRGGNVKIGAGCRVDVVEYKHTLDTTSDAKVKESRKI